MFALNFRNTTLMEVWRMFRIPGQPRSHERDIRDGGLYRRHLRWRPKDSSDCLCVVRERAGFLVVSFWLWDKQEQRGKVLS